MKKAILVILILVLASCMRANENKQSLITKKLDYIKPLDSIKPLEKLKLENAKLDDSLFVRGFECLYYDSGVYLINKDYVVFEDCETRKIVYPDMKSFRLPKHNEEIFAIDKNGVYLKGNLVKTDTTGFQIIGRDGQYGKYEFLWKTKQGIYKGAEKLTTISSPETFKALECFGGYFIDEDFVYYFDKKIEGSDPKTIKKTCRSFTYDKNFVYNNGEKAMHNGEFLIPVNDFLLKTKTKVLTRDRRRPNNQYKKTKLNFDLKTLRGLSASYAIDKYHVYFEHEILPIKRKNFKNIRTFEQVNSVYLTDGVNVYCRGELEKGLDGKTFYMFPKSDTFFDKNGIYTRKWIEEKEIVINDKFPFEYTSPVTPENTFNKQGLYFYKNQVYTWRKVLYKLTDKELIQAKKGVFLFGNTNKNTNKKSENYKEFDYTFLYRNGDGVYHNGSKTLADSKTFQRLGYLFCDSKNVYSFDRNNGLNIIEGIDAKSVENLNLGLYKDKNYVYYYNVKIIKSDGFEFLGVFTGYRAGCGQDETPTSDYYLLKNSQGFWLVENELEITIRFLGEKLQKGWNPKLKKEFVLAK